MRKKRSNRGVPRRKRMRRQQRLQVAPGWIATYPGKNIVRGYRKYFGVDFPCAVRELQMLGVRIDPDYLARATASYEGQQKQRQQRKAAKQAERAAHEQNGDFYYIVGYTSGGAPYGVTWEEMEMEPDASSLEGNHIRQPVDVQEVVRALDFTAHDLRSYINCATGKIVIRESESLSAVEETAVGDVPEGDWNEDDSMLAEAVLTSDDFIPLPTRFEVHEWSIMVDFSSSRSHDTERAILLDALHGRDAFRRFDNTIRQLDILDEWYRFRHEALERIAIDFLESHALPYRNVGYQEPPF